MATLPIASYLPSRQGEGRNKEDEAMPIPGKPLSYGGGFPRNLPEDFHSSPTGQSRISWPSVAAGEATGIARGAFELEAVTA